MAKFRAESLGREWLELTESDGQYGLAGLGDLSFLKSLQQSRELVGGWASVDDLKVAVASFASNSIFDLMMREVLQKATGEWQEPFTEDELCHCRLVPTVVVDSAILAGAHTPEEVSRQTNASTQCGTCRPDVEKILAARLR